MKLTTLFILIFFLFFYSNTIGQTTTITVDNADEFVAAIGPDRVIQLKGSTIYLSNISSGKSGTYFYFYDEYDGNELRIKNVSNLTIKGLGDKQVKIITKPKYGDVIAFENCSNITIENVEAGHGPEKGTCAGGVFNISDSKNFTINNCIMYGSGIEGITATKTIGLKCTNSIIRSCSYSIMTLDNCQNFQFTNCEFSDNKEFDLVNITNCISTKFNTCTFSNNETNQENDGYALFNVSQSMSTILTDCTIENNSCAYLATKGNSIELNNTKIENNSFRKGNSKE